LIGSSRSYNVDVVGATVCAIDADDTFGVRNTDDAFDGRPDVDVLSRQMP